MVDNGGEEKTPERRAAELRAKKLQERKAKPTSPFMPSKQSQRKQVPPAGQPLALPKIPEVVTNQGPFDNEQLSNSGATEPASDSAAPAPPPMPAPSNNEFQQTPEEQQAAQLHRELQKWQTRYNDCQKDFEQRSEEYARKTSSLEADIERLKAKNKNNSKWELDYQALSSNIEKIQQKSEEVESKNQQNTEALRHERSARRDAENQAKLANKKLEQKRKNLAEQRAKYDTLLNEKLEADNARNEFEQKLQRAQAELDQIHSMIADLDEQQVALGTDLDNKIHKFGAGLTLQGYEFPTIPKRGDAEIKRESSEESLTEMMQKAFDEEAAATKRHVSMGDEMDAATAGESSDENDRTDDEDKTLTKNELPTSGGAKKQTLGAEGLEYSRVWTVVDEPPIAARLPIQVSSSVPVHVDVGIQTDNVSQTPASIRTLRPGQPGQPCLNKLSEQRRASRLNRPAVSASPADTRKPFLIPSQDIVRPSKQAEMDALKMMQIRYFGMPIEKSSAPAEAPFAIENNAIKLGDNTEEQAAPAAGHKPKEMEALKSTQYHGNGMTTEESSAPVEAPLVIENKEISLCDKGAPSHVTSGLQNEFPKWFWLLVLVVGLLAVFIGARTHSEEILWRMANDTTHQYFFYRQYGGSPWAAPAILWSEPTINLQSFLFG